MDTHKHRTKSALVIICIAILSTFIISHINKLKDLNNLIKISNNYNESLSEDVINELFDLSSSNIINLKNYENKIISFEINKNLHDTFSKIKQLLENNNWIFIPNDNENYATFSKNFGKYTWLFMTCTQLENENCMVVITLD